MEWSWSHSFTVAFSHGKYAHSQYSNCTDSNETHCDFFGNFHALGSANLSLGCLKLSLKFVDSHKELRVDQSTGIWTKTLDLLGIVFEIFDNLKTFFMLLHPPVAL